MKEEGKKIAVCRLEIETKRAERDKLVSGAVEGHTCATGRNRGEKDGEKGEREG